MSLTRLSALPVLLLALSSCQLEGADVSFTGAFDQGARILSAELEPDAGPAGDLIQLNLMLEPGTQKARGTVSAYVCLLYTSPSPRDQRGARMPSSA